jgi:hypothetical protein
VVILADRDPDLAPSIEHVTAHDLTPLAGLFLVCHWRALPHLARLGLKQQLAAV